MLASAVAGKRTKRRRKPLHDQKFSNYLSFGAQGTFCLIIFLIIYGLVLLCSSPLLFQAAPSESSLKRGQVLKPVVNRLGQKVNQLKDNVPSIAKAMRDKLQNLRKTNKVTDKHLIDRAHNELAEMRKKRAAVMKKASDIAHPGTATVDGSKKTGFIVLGMHRSGTSMLSGLLVNGLGYNPGGPLIGSKFDNEKGFFELIDAVLQNDEFMNLQRVWWSANVQHYDPNRALEDKKNGRAKFRHGKKALAFLNDPDSAPWLQKDPRMCITLKSWLPLLNSEPAILFTYRHPLEVSNSLIRREKTFTLDHTLKLWIFYNIAALKNSAGLCRVFSSNDAVLTDPMPEVQRISDALTKCGVPKAPEELTKDIVDKFIDPNLIHNTKKVGDDLPVLEKHGDCVVHELATKTSRNTPQHARETTFYRVAMKLYCDMESGAAYKDDYVFPTVPE